MVITAGNESRRKLRWGGLTAIIDFAAASHLRALALLVVCALCCFLPGFFSIPPLDRDEARFAQATKQMVESGEYIDIRFQDEVRYKKPVGIYWLQAGVVKAAAALGMRGALTTIWLYRLPSLIGAVGAVLLTYWAALALVSRRAALLAGLMLASCVLLGVERLMAKTDAMLLLTVVAAMGAMGRIYVARSGPAAPPAAVSWSTAAVFWTALAAGILLKGPVILLVVGLAAVALLIVDRSGSWLLALKPLPGLIWLALLVLPWFVAITGRAGETFFAESVGQDLFSKIFSGQESHGAPPGYYLALFWITFWPGATLAALATPATWASRREPSIKFLLAWLLPSWLVFELVITKLPHYVLPLYPAIAILIANAIDTHALSQRPGLVWGTIWWFVVALGAGLLGLVALAVIGRQFGLLAWPLIGAGAVMSLLAWRLYEVDGAEDSLLRAIVAAILIAIALFGVITPSLAPLFPSVALARVLREVGCSRPQAVSVGYEEPSLVFLAGTETRFTDAASAAEFLNGGPCRFAFVEARQERSFGQRAELIGLRYSAAARIDGFNMSNGHPITVAVYRSAELP
ncbi:MAG: ArnT family glycosyltransferase [Xanthobacteraceae bacterium]